MSPLLGLLFILVAATASVALLFWLERKLRQPGLAFLLFAIALLAASAFGFRAGQRLIPALFCFQAVGFVFSARWRRHQARAASLGAVNSRGDR